LRLGGLGPGFGRRPLAVHRGNGHQSCNRSVNKICAFHGSLLRLVYRLVCHSALPDADPSAAAGFFECEAVDPWGAYQIGLFASRGNLDKSVGSQPEAQRHVGRFV
jgi:hypothetical protein